MGNIWKRLLSLTLAMVMVLGMVPVQAFAAEDAGETAAVVAETEAATGETPVVESSEPAPETTEAPATPETTVAPETTEAPAGELAEDAAVKSVQALIDALPTAVNSAEEAETLNAALAAVSDAIAGLTTEQAAQLDMGKYYTAMSALESWYNQDYSRDVLEDLVNCYWDGDTLYIKDGVAIDLYSALLNKTGVTSLKGMKYATSEITKWNYALTGTAISSGSSVSLNQGTCYYCIQKSYTSYTNGSFQVKHYYDLTAKVADGSPEGAAISMDKSRVNAGDTVKITVAEVEGYTVTVTDAKGNVIKNLDAYAPEGSTTLTATYVSNAVTKYNVTLETVGEGYGTAELRSESSLIAGAEVLVSAEPREGAENLCYYVESVMAGDTELTVNADGYYTYTMGESDVTVTVTFAKAELTASEKDANGETIEVKFNGYADATVDQQLEETEKYFADVEEERYLEQVILDALNVALNDTKVETKDVEIRYLPWYYGVLSGWNTGESIALDGTPKEDALRTAYAFGTSGKNEKIVISYTLEDGTILSVTREITLTEGRKEREITYAKGDTETNPVSYESTDVVEAAIKANVTLSGLSWDGIALTTDKLPDSGKTEQVKVTVDTDSGDATYVPTASFDLWIKAPDAVANVNFDVHGSGTVKVGDLEVSGTLTPGKYAITATADASNDKSVVHYLDSVTVTCGETTVTPGEDGLYDLEGDKTYTVTAEFQTASVVLKENQTLSVNRYDYDTKIKDLKNNVLTTVLEGYSSESAGEYTVTLKGTFEYNLDKVSGYNDLQKGFFNADLGGNTLTVTVTGKHGETASVSVKLAEARQEYVIRWKDPTVDFDSQVDIDAAVMDQLEELNTDCGTITATLAADQELPGTSGGELTYNVTVAANETYLGTTGTVKITAKANSKPAQVSVTTIGEGSGEHTIPASAYETVDFTVTPKKDGSYVESVQVACGDDTADVELTYKDTVASGSFPVENDKSYTVTITYGKATLEVAQDAEVALNLYVGNYVDYSARLDGLKGKLLNALLGEDVSEDDYEVYVYTTKLSILGADGYKSVDAVDFSLYASQIKDTIRVKIVKQVSEDGKIPAVTVEDISVQVVESRQTASIDVETVNEITVTNSLDPVITAVKAATKTNGGTVTAEITSGELPTPENPNGTVTLTVTVAESKDALANTTGVTVAVAVKLAEYTLTWNAGDGAFAGGGKTITTGQYYGETVTKPESEPAKEQTVSHTYTFDGWDGLDENTTVTGKMTFTARYDEALRKYTITWNAGVGAFAEEKKEVTTEVEYGKLPTAPEDPEAEDKSFERWDPAITAVTGTAAYTAVYSDDTIYKVTFVYGNGTDDETIRVNATREEVIPDKADPQWDGHVFTGWECNVDGVAFGKTPDCEQKEITFTAQWADDANGNGVDDEEETITICIEGAGENDVLKIGGTELKKGDKYIFDSTREETLTITATPVVTDGVSQTYVAGIAVGNGEQNADLEVTYGKNYVATASFQPENGMEITVTFADAAFRLKEGAVLNYYPGMTGVTSQNVYESIVESPEWDAEAVTVEYLAREGGEAVKINIANLTFGSNATVDGLVKAALKVIYTDGYISVEQGETWVELGEELPAGDIYDDVDSYEELINKILNEKLANIDWKNISKEIQNIIADIQDSTKFYGAHAFGYNASTSQDTQETIRLTYTDNSRKIQNSTSMTLHDYRTPTQIVGSDMTLVYKDFKDNDLLTQVKVCTTDGAEVSGAAVTLTKESVGLEDKSVSENAYEVAFRFAGNETYKPAEAIFQVTITKASASMDIDNVIVTHGEGYSMNHNITRGNAYGDDEEIEDSLIRFVVGLNVAGLSVDEDGISGTDTLVQLMLPENLKDGLGSLTGNLFKDGVDMSLSDLLAALELIDADSLEVLKQALEAISSITGDFTIRLGGNLPTDTGTYLYGAVSTTGNYETVLDVAYIIIKPDAQRVYLNWNYADSNGIFTDELLQHVDLGASAYDENTFATKNDAATAKVRNLFFGVNKGEDNKPALALKLYGAGIDPENFERELGNGGFTQMAFIADFGNEMHYAIPIVRAFAIVPNNVTVSITDGEGTAFRRTYDGEKQELTITVNGSVPESGLEVTYVGITTRGKVYNSETAPTDAGAYVVTAIYRAHDDNGKLTGIGMAVKDLLVLPAKTETTVDDAIITVGETVKLEDIVHITAVGNPDKTILTAQLATDGSFSENGLTAISGNVNVDFPAWVDAILQKKAPEIYKGVTVSELSEILNGKIKTVLDDLELGDELTQSLTEILDQLNAMLQKLPGNATVTFNDTDAKVFSQAGIYLVGAMVTDSNYQVSADYGLVVVKPNAQQVYLDWNYHDNNGIWTEELLKNVDLYASAYTDPECLYKDEKATKTITHTFLTVDSNGEVKVYHNAENLGYGAYLELAYIELNLDGNMTFSDLIARPIVTVPNAVKVEFVDENNTANADRKFSYDGNPHAMDVRVTKNGNPVEVQEGELTVTYRGLTTAGETYNSTTAPTDAGAYTVTAVYAKYENGKLIDGGAAVGAMVIEPAVVEFSVTGSMIPYDGEAHGVTVEAPENAQYTLISATANVSGAFTEIGFEAVSGDLNVDFPAWVDAILEAEHPEIYKNGITAKTLIDKLNALNLSGTWVDTLVKLLEKAPSGMKVTFQDNIQFEDPGVYVFAGFLTDFNYVPASDTALLVIRKVDSQLAFVDTEVYYNGETQSIDVTNPCNTDYVTVIVDRQNNIANILFENDLKAVKALLEEALGYPIPNTIDVTALMTAVNGAIEKAQALENLPVDVQDALEQLKVLVDKLPQTGTIYIDGTWRPVDAGEYEFYGIALSPFYQTELLSATLTILPADVTITVANQEMYYGEKEPEAKAEVNVTKGAVDQSVLNIQVTREAGTDAGTYPYAVTYTKSKNYTVTEDLGSLTIKPAEITIEVKSADKVEGEEDPENAPIITVCNPKGATLDTSVLNIKVTRAEGETAGEYPYSVTYTAHKNFNVLKVTADKLTINARDAGGDEDNKTDKYPITFKPDDAGTIQPGATVEIDGKPYELDENCTVWVEDKDAKIAQTFAYYAGGDAHHTYPTHMYVWYLTFTEEEGAHYDAEPIPELTDFFQYHGTSIRVNFTSNGIRFMTSVNEQDASALMQGNLIQTDVMAGYQMTQTGTLFKWYTGAALTNDGNTASSLVYGVAGENDMRVFQQTDGRDWFTGMLTGLETDKETLQKDLVSRPYAVLVRDGESITIYGGTIQRSIYYVAKQNEEWQVGTVYNDYIKSIISAVEGQ